LVKIYKWLAFILSFISSSFPSSFFFFFPSKFLFYFLCKLLLITEWIMIVRVCCYWTLWFQVAVGFCCFLLIVHVDLFIQCFLIYSFIYSLEVNRFYLFSFHDWKKNREERNLLETKLIEHYFYNYNTFTNK